MEHTPPHYNDLDEVHAAAWQMLERGARDRHALAHTPVLATVADDGSPDARTVVLRDCAAGPRTLTVHTDTRSAKVAQLRARPDAVLHVYEPAEKIQLRANCVATVHIDDDETRHRWQQTAPMSQVCYQVVQAPGSVIEGPRDANFDGGSNANGYDFFAVLELQVIRLEWLYLHALGHRRAVFDYDRENTTRGWLVP